MKLSLYPKFLFFLFSLFFCGELAFCSDRLEVSVNPEVGSPGSEFEVKISATVQGGQLSLQSIENNPNFFLTSQNYSSETYISTQGVEIASSIFLTFLAHEKLQPGKYLLPSIVVKSPFGAGKVSNLTVEISNAPQNSPTLPTSREGVTVSQQVSNKTPYIGEQVVITTYVAAGQEIISGKISDITIPDVVSASLGKNEERKRRVAGTNTTIFEIRKPVFSTRSGNIKIPGRTLTAEIRKKIDIDAHNRRMGLFAAFSSLLGEVETVNVSADPIDLEAKKLPTPNIDISQSYIPVGHLSLSNSQSGSLVGDNSAVTVSIVITGDALLAPLETPDINITGIKVYKNEPKLSNSVSNDRIIYRKEFSYTLVAKKNGTFEFPSITYIYFNPTTETYETLVTQSYPLIASGITEKDSANSPNSDTSDPAQSSFTIKTENRIVDYSRMFLLTLGLLLPSYYWLSFLSSTSSRKEVSPEIALLSIFSDKSLSHEVKSNKMVEYLRSSPKELLESASVSEIVTRIERERFSPKRYQVTAADLEELYQASRKARLPARGKEKL